MEMDSDESHPLPHQIILNILSRLPVKSLLRSKLVCKEWRHSISTPQFTKLHLSQSQLTTTHHVALLESRNPPSSIALRSIESHSDESVIEIHNSFKYAYPNSKIISSCNGLLLIALSQKTFIVWNPSTREYEHLGCLPHFLSFVFILSGLGYDKLVDEYKVVMAIRVIENNESDCEKNIYFYCYSSKCEGEPRSIKMDFPYTILKDTSATVVNGVPHWLVNHDRGEKSPVIIYFDFVAEVFVELTQPSYGHESLDISKFDLGVLGGCLSIVCHREHYVEVLLLKRYRMIESWTKLFVICYENSGHLSFKTLKPLCFTKNGEVLMEIDRKRLVVYNLEESSYRFVEFSHNGNGFKVVMYVESLVSPHGASKSKQRPYWNMASMSRSSTSKVSTSRSSTSKIESNLSSSESSARRNSGSNWMIGKCFPCIKRLPAVLRGT
ncbi:hypothetical protein ACSBR2_031206 [Camellia fascicularis]